MPSKKRTQKQRSPVEQLRSVCLSFPEAHEVEAWGEPTFRVKNKMFAMYASSDTHHGGGRPSVWVKSTLVNQDLLVRWQPARYFVPPYVGPSGWIGIYLDKRPSWKTIADIVRDAYLLILPKKLRAKIEK
jgi:predicted DNA-binding protein (MmcQ/YjbR family)